MDTLNTRVIKFLYFRLIISKTENSKNMLKSREFFEIYDGVMRTFKKRVAVLLDKESTLNLISISAYVFR